MHPHITMQSTKASKEQSAASKVNANRNDGANGISMPAVPVLQPKDTANIIGQQAAPQIDANSNSVQLKPFDAAAIPPIQKEENKTGLPDSLKTGIENLSGFSMDDTRVHYNSSQPAQLNAHAYAQGSNIHVAPGQEKHLAHEAWHIVQQKQGRVQATAQMKAGVPVNNDAGLEHEADVMGSKAAQLVLSDDDKVTQAKTDEHAVIQRVVAHRPAIGMEINYNGHRWQVTASARGNPNITINRAGGHNQTIAWATAAFTIVRANTNQDHDMRQGENAYSAAGFASPRESEILARFNAAKLQALTMIKASALLSVQLTYQNALNALTLDDFKVTKHGPTLIGPSATQAAEWECNWVEGTSDNPRRTWTFIIDADNPEGESSQEPHVGWQVSAKAGAVAAVPRVLGHVWLDYVTVARTAL